MESIYKRLDMGMTAMLEAPDPMSAASLCAELGLRFVELNMNLPAFQIGSMDEREMRRAADQYGIYYTLHLDEQFNAADFNPLIEDAYRRTALEAIALAKRHGMPVVNMHLHEGIYFSLPEGKVYLFARYLDAYLGKLRAFRTLCEDAVGGAGICIAIENCGGFRDFSLQAISMLLESPIFGLTLDIGHNRCANRVDEPFYMANKNRLYHLHLHDADAKACHLPLGCGELSIPDEIRALTSAKRAVLEVKTPLGLRQSLGRLRSEGL